MRLSFFLFECENLGCLLMLFISFKIKLCELQALDLLNLFLLLFVYFV